MYLHAAKIFCHVHYPSDLNLCTTYIYATPTAYQGRQIIKLQRGSPPILGYDPPAQPRGPYIYISGILDWGCIFQRVYGTGYIAGQPACSFLYGPCPLVPPPGSQPVTPLAKYLMHVQAKIPYHVRYPSDERKSLTVRCTILQKHHLVDLPPSPALAGSIHPQGVRIYTQIFELGGPNRVGVQPSSVTILKGNNRITV